LVKEALQKEAWIILTTHTRIEKVNVLQNCIVSAMTEYADYLSGSKLPKVEYSVLTDEKHGKYQLLAVGWEKKERIYSIIFHTDIVGEHIWIQ